MAEPTQGAAASEQPAMPQPTPIFDVTFRHVYTGQVFRQLYVFFYIGVAFLVGAILPWNGVGDSQLPNLFQGIMIVAGVACTVAGWLGIRGRHAFVTPFMMTEILAILFLLLTFMRVTAERDKYDPAALAAIDSQLRVIESGPEREALLAERMELVEPWKLKDLVLGSFTTFRKVHEPERARFERAAGSFGTGFYLTVLTSLFMFVFMIFSIFGATKASKAKKEAEATASADRRRASRGNLGGAKPGGKADGEADEAPKKA